MSAVVLVAAVVAAVNAPARVRCVGAVTARALLVAAAATVAVAAGLAAVAGPLLDAADVSAPNARVAAGLVLVVAGAVDLARRGPRHPLPRAALAGLVPVAFPLLLQPQVGVVALSAGADRGVGAVAVATAVALIPLAGAGRVPPWVLAWLGRALGAVGMVAGTALVADGVLSV